MPTLCRFFGITVRMYYDDHEPSHFHAFYGDFEAKLAIESLAVLEGSLPRRALALVLEWASLHRLELQDNWRRAREHDTLLQIQPLE
jgi:hypothetical protein